MNLQKFDQPYDVVVIGAGNGGLTAATQLAISGKKIILFEQHNLPGGFATSFIRGRFEFEATLHEFKLKTTAVVQRIRDTKTGKWTCKTLSWKTD